MGREVIGPVDNLSDARALIEHDGFDVAIVDIDLHNEMAFILGDALARQNIPFLFATGYSAEVIPAREKPYVVRRLLEDVGRLCIRKQAPTGETA
jgi:hypothetical protein